jgi:hypothetical protein
MHSYLSDIDPRAEQAYLVVLRRLSPFDKAGLIASMIQSGRELILLNIRARHPDATDRQVFRYFAEAVLGPELALRVYGPLAEE